jgi:NADP-dependent 3-hydroxy acid dehydrogenase YdfG
MKTVLVTGASRGLGLELARQYVHKTKEGDATPAWRVVVCVRGDPPHDTLYDELRQGHEGCTSFVIITLDVACSDAFDANFRNALKSIGRIDVLINNAGVCIGRECAVGNVDYDAWTRSFNTNVMGSMRVLEHCLPHLTSDATVVNISGRMGSIGRVLSGLGASSATTQDVVYRTDEGCAEHDDRLRRRGDENKSENKKRQSDRGGPGVDEHGHGQPRGDDQGAAGATRERGLGSSRSSSPSRRRIAASFSTGGARRCQW